MGRAKQLGFCLSNRVKPYLTGRAAPGAAEASALGGRRVSARARADARGAAALPGHAQPGRRLALGPRQGQLIAHGDSANQHFLLSAVIYYRSVESIHRGLFNFEA